MIPTVKGFSLVNKAEVDIFLEMSCFFDDPVDVGDFISSSSAFLKSSSNIWKLTVYILLKPGLGSVGALYAPGEEWRNNSRKNEATYRKQEKAKTISSCGCDW